MLFQSVLLLFLSACVTMAQPPLPTLAPTAVSPTIVTAPTNTLLPPPPTLTAPATAVPASNTPVIDLATATPIPTTPAATATHTAVPTASANLTNTLPTINTIGTSVQGRPIVNYSFGNGPTQVIFVGGLHGGYEWNTILLAYEIIDHYTANPQLIPPALTVHIVPSANPDGQYLTTNRSGRFQASDVVEDTIPGRFNANNVDLNRNWDCEWVPTAVWRDVPVSGGPQPFSEPESVALRDFILPKDPAIVVFWHSAANGVFATGCPETHVPSVSLAQIYGQAANYPVYERFTSYKLTGDAGDWLATQDIPSISIELQNHQSLDLSQNVNGVQALLNHLSQP